MGRTVTSDPNVIALPASPTGFTAGDYVYQTRTGYGSIPSGALATGNFDVGALATPVYASTASTSNELTYVEQLGGSMGSQVAAQLTNGNIVYAYATGNTTTYTSAATVNFRIETTAGSVVVAQTSTTMTVQGPFHVSVIALPAGGFCIVASVPNAANFSFSARFYNADGTTATAVLAAGLSLTGSAAVSRLKLQALSDGSVIIGYAASTNFEIRRVTTAGFDATFNGGAGLYSTSLGGPALNNYDFLVDGSDNIQLIFTSASTNAIMRRLNSSGVQQTSSAVTMTGVAGVAIVRTSDGTIRGIVQDSTGITTLTWDGTTAALGTRVITATTPPVNGALAAFAQGASGGYVIFYNTYIGNTNAVGLYFQAFSSANASLATATRVNSAIAVSYRTQFTPIVISGNTRVYFGVFQANAVNYTYGAGSAVPMGVVYFAYSNTTYALVGAPTVNYNWGSQGPYALGAYMRSASTAAVAKFTIATTGTYPVTSALGATLIQKTLVDGNNAALRLSLAPLPNGEFVSVWARTTGQPTYISKYSAAGVLQAGPVLVGTGSSNAWSAASVAVFANGNILVTYVDTTTTTLRFRIYNSSLSVVTSGDIDTSVNVVVSALVSCASFGDGDHIAVAFNDSSNNIHVRCVRSTGTVTARLGSGLTATTSWQAPQVIGFKSNAFAIAAFANDGGLNVYGYVVRKTGATTFLADSTRIIGSSFSSTAGSSIFGSPIPTPGTSAYYVAGGVSANAYRLLSVNPLIATNNQLSVSETSGTFSGLGFGANNGTTIGYTATGLPVLVGAKANTQFLTLSAITPPMDGNVSSGNTVTAGVITTLATSTNNYVCVSAIPHVGDAILIGYIDSNGYPSFVSIAASPFTVNATLTAGVDISTSGLILTQEGGYSLQGVSLTAASSGSSGLVQTRGVATLNSNYSAATTATTFDFRNPLTFGTYGTIIGRSVIMGY